jgi:hypothetical protein
MPVRNTSGNSRPLAECRLMSCTQSSQASAWPSPASSAACARNAASGSRPFGVVVLVVAGGGDQLLQVLDPHLALLALVVLV